MNCIFLRRGYGTGLNLSDTFSENSWETIIKACAANAVPATWTTQDSKPMTIGGVDYEIGIMGKGHDEFSDGSGKAPLTLAFISAYGTKLSMNSSNTNGGGWRDSVTRNTHVPTVLSAMPSEVQAAIKPVNKLTSAGSQSTTIVTTEDTLFPFSEVEVFGTTTHSASGEGSQYAYFKNGGSKIKYVGGTAVPWRLRSPVISRTTHFGYVETNGTSDYGGASTAYYTPFAFCFGSGGITSDEDTPPTITISGNRLDSTYGYVTINGSKYTETATVVVERGAAITVVCGADHSSIYNATSITFNGQTVAQGVSGTSTISHSFTATKDTIITMNMYSPNGAYVAYSAAITTE